MHLCEGVQAPRVFGVEDREKGKKRKTTSVWCLSRVELSGESEKRSFGLETRAGKKLEQEGTERSKL
jgi:hypothetical protein